MKITKVKVQTLYDVEIPLDELNEMLANPKVYDNEPKELTKAGYFNQKQLTANQANEIAFQLGYLAWENIGHVGRNGKYCMVFRNNGDTFNN